MVEWYWLIVAFLGGPIAALILIHVFVAAAEPDGDEFYAPRDRGEIGTPAERQS